MSSVHIPALPDGGNEQTNITHEVLRRTFVTISDDGTDVETRDIPRGTFVALAYDSYVLPSATAKLDYTIKNGGAHSLSIFANPTPDTASGVLDTIEDAPNLTVAADESVHLYCPRNGIWEIAFLGPVPTGGYNG
jgi:hypothetical protein